jgi:phage gpG-like protein
MDFRQTQQAIEQALTKIKSGTVKALAIEWRKSITKNFDSKGRPAWPARKRISKKQRGTNILVISGAMKNVSTVPNIAQLTVTLTVDPRAKAYAKIHNEGGKINMPARELKFRKNRQGRTVFASAQAKKVAKTTTSAAYTIVIPKREYTNIPREDFPRIVEAIKQQIKL